MQSLEIVENRYSSPLAQLSSVVKVFPSFCFYLRFMSIVFLAAKKAKRGMYSDEVWCEDSLRVFRLLEKIGIGFEIDGIDNFSRLETPCVFVGNHMSIMETLILPAIILPFASATFVVKDSLLTYPVFKHVMRACNPVAVTRTNPRQDLKTVMSEGCERLARGISIIVFPQTTRSLCFEAENFGSIGTKLAKKAGVPVVPVALKTDAWRNGSVSKDFGPLLPHIPVKVSFGHPLAVSGKGSEEQQQVVEFISQKLQQWRD